MAKMYTCNKHSSEKGRIPIRGQAVRHTRHGLEAWNSKRLWYYEDFRSLREANNYIQKYIDAGEIKHFFRDFYIINDDIVAVLDVKEDDSSNHVLRQHKTESHACETWTFIC